MLKTLLAAAVAGLFAAAHAAAPASTAARATPAPAAAGAGVVPLLWKVSDADNSVYLLGSFHLLKAGDDPISKDVEAAFADAESLLFEITPEQLADPATAIKFQQAMVYTDGRTLSKVLPADTRGRLEGMLGASGQPVAALDALEPWAVSLTLAIGAMQSLGFLPDQGVDRLLMQRAAAAGKPVAGLESVDDQIRALDGTPESEQIAALDDFIADPKRSMQQLIELHGAWRAGDAGKLDRQFRAEMAKDTPETYRLINVERNRRWVPQLVTRLEAGNADDTLAVVGALHLLGPDGVVEQLKAKGYRVERVGASSTATAAGAAR